MVDFVHREMTFVRYCTLCARERKTFVLSFTFFSSSPALSSLFFA